MGKKKKIERALKKRYFASPRYTRNMEYRIQGRFLNTKKSKPRLFDIGLIKQNQELTLEDVYNSVVSIFTIDENQKEKIYVRDIKMGERLYFAVQANEGDKRVFTLPQQGSEINVDVGSEINVDLNHSFVGEFDQMRITP